MRLQEERERISYLIKELNECNAPDVDLQKSIPAEVLGYVDAKLAAKGLLSLLVESLAAIEKELEELGVDLSAPKAA